MKPSQPESSKSDAKSTPTPPAEAAQKPDESKPADAKYVFKILPANPKNAFDFEDVADK